MGKSKDYRKPPDYYPWVTEFIETLMHSPKERRVLDRFRERHEEMREVYKEIHSRLERLPLAPWIKPENRAFPVMNAIIEAAVRYGSEQELSRKDLRDNLRDIGAAIVQNVHGLIELLNRHERENTRGPVITDTDFNLWNLIDRAGRGHLLFDSHILPHIQEIKSYDERYYPSLRDILRVVIDEVESNEPQPMYPEDAIVWMSQKPSQNDFIRYLDDVLTRTIKAGQLPSGFKLSQASMATITECSLNSERGSIDTGTVSKALAFKKKRTFRAK